MQERHQKSLNYALNVIKSSKMVESVWLFGSCSRGEEKFNSDVDLVIKIKREYKENYKEMRMLRSCCMPLDWKLPEVDIKFEIDDWNLKDDQFSRNLRKDAIKIWQI